MSDAEHQAAVGEIQLALMRSIQGLADWDIPCRHLSGIMRDAVALEQKIIQASLQH